MTNLPPGTPVKWTDANGRIHRGIVAEMTDAPKAMVMENRIRVIETICAQVPHWKAASDLTPLDTPEAPAAPDAAVHGKESSQ